MATRSDWNEKKHLLMERWPGLPERELDATGGNREGILALLEGRLGYARKNAEGDLDALLSGESTVSPHDVADATHHPGSDGPVGTVPVDRIEEEGGDRETPGGPLSPSGNPEVRTEATTSGGGTSVMAGEAGRSGTERGGPGKSGDSLQVESSEQAAPYAEGEQAERYINPEEEPVTGVDPARPGHRPQEYREAS